MYVRSSRSAKSWTNSLRSLALRACQCGPSARFAVSLTSKISTATLRTAARLSVERSAGSSRILRTWSVYCRTCSVGAPARAGAAAARATSPAAKRTRSRMRILLVSNSTLYGRSRCPASRATGRWYSRCSAERMHERAVPAIRDRRVSVAGLASGVHARAGRDRRLGGVGSDVRLLRYLAARDQHRDDHRHLPHGVPDPEHAEP